MQTYVDLHLHSTASDGTRSPSELIELAAERGLSIIAITDHDTFDGIPRGMEAADSMGITMIPGVELSVDLEEKGLSAHLLGYFPGSDPDKLISGSTPLGKAITFIQGGRERRNPRILEKLSHTGIHIDIDSLKLIAGGDVIGRPHIAEALIAGGHVGNFREAFDRYLAKGKPAYVDRDRLPVHEAVRLIADADGLPVMAHPGYIQMEPNELKLFFGRMKNYGLAGIEAYYPGHSILFTRLLKEFASRYELVLTGGTDYHGRKQDAVPLGGKQDGFHITVEMVKDFLALCISENRR
ncbi:MAG: PHP domain-containing protein [Candidatus Aegiribacteria sp.]|nr:PHP domain-containing protein [Candidatus Aegiribacteria sp.]